MKLNNADRWLIERWEKLRQLENAMNGTRNRFESLYHEVHKKVQETHPALDRLDIHLSSKETESYGSVVIFSKGSWPSDYETWRTGIHLWRVSLNELLSDINGGPSIFLYFQTKTNDSRIETFRRRINAEAPRVFKHLKVKWSIKDEEDGRSLLWYAMPEGKMGLLKMLRNGKEQEFIGCIAKHVGVMSGFIPVLDKLFAAKKIS